MDNIKGKIRWIEDAPSAKNCWYCGARVHKGDRYAELAYSLSYHVCCAQCGETLEARPLTAEDVR